MLSGGQQQRVALARALIVEPETLLLDEPLSNLDANLREEMRFEIRRLHDEYRYTTVYVTHDQSEAMTTSDVICVMNSGKIEQAGSPVEIYDRPRSEFVARFIGMSNVFKGKALDNSRVSFAGSSLIHMTHPLPNTCCTRPRSAIAIPPTMSVMTRRSSTTMRGSSSDHSSRRQGKETITANAPRPIEMRLRASQAS